MVYRKLGRLSEAIAHLTEALRLKPDLAEARYNLGLAFSDQGNQGQAEANFRQALLLQPDSAETCNDLGNSLKDQGKLEEAINFFQQALRLKPDHVGALNNLGIALQDQGKIEEAEAYIREALRVQPSQVVAHSNLLRCLSYNPRVSAAALFEEHLRWARQHAAVLSEMVKERQGDKETGRQGDKETGRQGDKETKRQGDRETGRQGDKETGGMNFTNSPLTRRLTPLGSLPHHLTTSLPHHLTTRPPHDCTPDRRLRIGYVSPDFREHPVARFVEPLLAAHDHAHFEIFCYAEGHIVDAVTRRLQGHADQWRSLVGLSDEQATELIRQDAIDILVDLCGHTAGNRILVFARKPAPVQVSHFGYASTSGLSTMDYRITNALADPPGMTESLHTEELVRLPDVAWCYEPTAGSEVNPLPGAMPTSAWACRQPLVPHAHADVGMPPGESFGRVTFSSFNYLAKVNADVIALWAEIMKAVPQSRLLLLANVAMQGMENVLGHFAANGIGGDRVEFLRRGTREEYLAYYHAVDIGLDPFPYNGGVTTCDALWMGVPVVSLAGDAYISRQGVSLLSSVGLQDWIAATADEYREIAIGWANDLPGLQRLRAKLRQRVRNSPLTDGQRFTRNLETAYRSMWRRWCGTEHTPIPPIT